MKTKRLFLTFGILLLCLTPASSQIVIEEDVRSTDTIDIFKSAEREQTKSPRLAMFANLLVPGLGHKYLGFERRSFIFFATEALLITGSVFSERYSHKLYTNAISYAHNYAKISTDKDIDHIYWKIIGDKDFPTYKHFNNAADNDRIFDEKYVKPDETWVWEADVYQEHYRKTRKEAMAFHVTSSFFIGAMILNHVVAFIDVRIMAKRRSYASTTPTILPYYSYRNKKVGLVLAKNF